MKASTTGPRETYSSLISAPEADWDVFRLALEISRILTPNLSVAHYRDRVIIWASEACRLAGRQADALALVNAINQVLFEQHAFAGSTDDYYNPRNSYLAEVIERRRGIPITMSILYREVAALAGLELDWIALPGHFLLGLQVPGHRLYLDAFNRGQLLIASECFQLIRDLQPDPAFQPKLSHLGPVTNTAVLLRLLMNLKIIYRKAGDNRFLLEVIERRIPLLRNDLPEILERGLIKASFEDYRGALADIEHFLAYSKNEELKGTLAERLETIRRLAKGD